MVYVYLYTVNGRKIKTYLDRDNINDILATDLDPNYKEKGVYMIALTSTKFIIAHIQNDEVKTAPIDQLKMNISGISHDFKEYNLSGNFMIVKVKSEDDDTLVNV